MDSPAGPGVIKLPCLLFADFLSLFEISLRVTVGFCCKPLTQRKAVHSSLPLVVVWNYFRKLEFGSLAVLLLVYLCSSTSLRAHLHSRKCKIQGIFQSSLFLKSFRVLVLPSHCGLAISEKCVLKLVINLASQLQSAK